MAILATFVHRFVKINYNTMAALHLCLYSVIFYMKHGGVAFLG